MKMKKILLPGMMAALAFAACTNEEIVSQQTSEAPKADLSKRPVVGMVDLNFGPQTRITLGNEGFNDIDWEAGEDMIGARIIDEVKHGICGGEHASTKYEASNYAWSNYRYDYEADEVWRSDALMVEGNYMFYAPYNEKALYRDALKMEFPLNQTVNGLKAVTDRAKEEGNTTAIKNFFGNQEGQTVVVGHTFLSEADGGQFVSPEMIHLYAYPVITLVNNYTVPKMVEDEETGELVQAEDEDGTLLEEGAPITISEVTISSTNFYKYYTANHAGLIDALKAEYDAVEDPEDDENYLCDGHDEGILVGNRKNVAFMNNARTALVATPDPEEADEDGNTPDGKIIVALDKEVTLKPGEAVKFNVVMPAASYGAETALKVNVRVETEEGAMKFENKVFIGDEENADYLNYAIMKRYPVEEYNFPAGDADPYKKATAGTLATFSLEGELVPYDTPETEEPATEGIHNNKEFEDDFLALIKDNSTAKVEGTNFTLATDHTVTLNATLMAKIEEYLKNSNATVTFNTFLYVEGSNDATKPLVISKDKYPSFGKLIVKSGYVTLEGQNVNEVVVEGNAVVNYNGTTVSNVSRVTGNVSNATLTGTKIVFCGDLTLTNVTINGEADFDGACGNHTITLNGVTVNGRSHLSGKNNIVNDATLNGAVNVNGDATIEKLATATVKLHNGKTITVAGEEAMTWNLEMTKGGKLVVSNKYWAPTTVTTGDGKTTVEINADWAPESVKFAGTGDKIVDVNAAVDFTNIGWEAKTNAEGTLLSSYTINNYKTITSDLTVPANAVYNQSVENAAVTGDITNNGTINAWGVIGVATNNGEIVAKTETDEITVGAGAGEINNSKLAVVYDKSGTQTVYYEGNDISAERISAILAIKDARINKIISTAKWTINSNWSGASSTLKTIEFKGNNEMLYIGDADVNFSGLEIIINGQMSWRGRSLESAKLLNLNATYETGATLTTSKIDMTGAYADVLENGGTIVLTDNLELPNTMLVEGDVTVDLNGKTIKAGLFAENGSGNISDGATDSYAFWVKQGAKLTINGNGTIETQACKYSIAVWADGGEVVINGGTYKNAGEGSDLIYAKNGGKVIINNGKFIANEKQSGVSGTGELYSALNLHDTTTGNSITVVAGEFVNFNPGNNLSENPKVNFVADGSTLTAVGTKDGEVWTAKNAWTYTYGEIVEKGISNVTYTVTAPVAAN